MVNICDTRKCAGCYACVNICPKQCITMEYDEYGVLLSHISQDDCVDCKACQKICPVNNPTEKTKATRAIAAWHLDEETRKRSASGGAAIAMYETVISEGGICFGTRFNDDLSLSIQKAKNLEEIHLFRGSKYVQANVEFSYSEVREELKTEKTVLYVGTPCQIAGLRNFLRKPYDNLITVDLVCHGVPSLKYLHEHVNEINKDLKRSIDDISFRGAYSFELALFEKKENIYHKDRFLDSYFTGFLNGLFYRSNCYECPYACAERVGDITIGDFWGLGSEGNCEYNMGNGVSVLLPNTQKGEAFIEKLRERMFIDERPLTEAINGNSQLRHPSEKNEKYDLFRKLYLEKGFEEAAYECTKDEIEAYRKSSKVSFPRKVARKVKRTAKKYLIKGK